MSPSRTILHPTDFSEHSDLAFALACSLASGSRLVVLHVMPIPKLQTKRYYREEMEGALRRRQAEGGQVTVEYRLEEGDAAVGILRVAQECRSDLIVMGTLGRTRLNRLLMGSVAEQVVRNAPCPVLTVKAPVGAVPPVEESASEIGSEAPTAIAIRTILYPTDFSDRSEEVPRRMFACRETCGANYRRPRRGQGYGRDSSAPQVARRPSGRTGRMALPIEAVFSRRSGGVSR